MYDNWYTSCRTIYNNWYTSVDLAHGLNSKQTHLVGTLRANRKQNPKNLVSKKLKKGEVVALKSSTNILVLKWKDRRDLLMLSTCDDSQCSEVPMRRDSVKPKQNVVINYNAAKSAIDLADQLGSYNSPLRRSLKWYQKIAFNMILNISVVNALTLFNSVTNKKI
ncbi:piggyBac transposable element-derived protein 4-like [Nilaparvata lugens]|uniref:piggyBac transposable element-derived protein 4-like n=1 Tax=Nilaparvata lugens TaxID=108931 RepID=UPI00193C918A|nr:piggyBac transposable element-derived protein 4-like [Nilaparvata lugens]